MWDERKTKVAKDKHGNTQLRRTYKYYPDEKQALTALAKRCGRKAGSDMYEIIKALEAVCTRLETVAGKVLV